MTSNPAIFEKAILGAAGLRRAARAAGAEAAPTPAAIYQAIAIQDVQEACRRPAPRLGRRPTHYDGYVSLEVDPDLAATRERTLAQAREYWEARRPPEPDDQDPGHRRGRARRSSSRSTRASTSTSRCCSASRPTTTVAEAYIRGLERRHAEGETLDVHSVASFFVSRVDTEVDKRLEATRATRTCRARPAWPTRAPPTSASRRSSTASASPRCARPARRCSGRCGRRPASRTRSTPTRCTSTGSSRRETVNTMPMATLLAAAERAEVSRRDRRPGPDATTCGRWPTPASTSTTSPTSCCATASTRSSRRWRSCCAGIESKREAIVTGRPPTIEASLPDELEPAIAARVAARPTRRDVARRIWHKDATLWGPARRARGRPTGSAG